MLASFPKCDTFCHNITIQFPLRNLDSTCSNVQFFSEVSADNSASVRPFHTFSLNYWNAFACSESPNEFNSKQTFSIVKHAAIFFWMQKRKFSTTPKEQTTFVFRESGKKARLDVWPWSDRKRHNVILSCWKAAETETETAKSIEKLLLQKTWTL